MPVVHPRVRLAACAIAAVVASSLVRSPVAALAACGAAYGAGRVTGHTLRSAVAGLAWGVVVFADPFLDAPIGVGAALAAAVLMLAGANLPPLWAATSRRADEPEPGSLPGSNGGGRRTPSLTPTELRASMGEGRRMSGPQQPARELHEVADVVQRYLRDTRDALTVDSVFFLRPGAQNHLEPYAWSSGGPPDITPLQQEPVASLLRWAATERAVVANDDSDPALVIAGPVGRGGSFLGVLVLYAADRQRLTRDKLRPWLGRHASHLALLLELVDDARSARRYRQRAQAFLQAAQRIQHNLDLPQLGRKVCEAAIEVSAGERAAFVLWDEGAVEGTVHTVSHGHPLTPGLRVTRDSIVAEWCREQRRFPMPHADRMAPGRPVYGTGEPLRRIGSFGIVPVLSGRRTVGAIVVEGDAPGQIGSVETETLQLLATPTAVALDNTFRLSQAEESARIDALTGLGNRRAFDEHLSQMLGESDRYGQLVSLVLVDMDHFKQINDSCGHDAGDMVLRLAAKALERTVRETDFCARYGGEELAILMSRTGLTEAAEAAERVRRAIEQIQVDVSGRGLLVTASLGVACYPESTPTREMFFAAADRALYEAKTAGRNCVKLASANAAFPMI